MIFVGGIVVTFADIGTNHFVSLVLPCLLTSKMKLIYEFKEERSHDDERYDRESIMKENVIELALFDHSPFFSLTDTVGVKAAKQVPGGELLKCQLQINKVLE